MRGDWAKNSSGLAHGGPGRYPNRIPKSERNSSLASILSSASWPSCLATIWNLPSSKPGLQGKYWSGNSSLEGVWTTFGGNGREFDPLQWETWEATGQKKLQPDPWWAWGSKFLACSFDANRMAKFGTNPMALVAWVGALPMLLAQATYILSQNDTQKSQVYLKTTPSKLAFIIQDEAGCRGPWYKGGECFTHLGTPDTNFWIAPWQMRYVPHGWHLSR